MTHGKAKSAEDAPWGLEGVQKDPNKVYKYANRKKPASNDQSGSVTNRPPPEKKPNLDKVQSDSRDMQLTYFISKMMINQ